MKKFKHFRKLLAILLGLFGLSAILSSCAKEKDCKCSYSYTYNGVTVSMEAMVITTKTKCEDLKFKYDGESMDLDCK